MVTLIVCNDTIAVFREIHHFVLPIVTAQGPARDEGYDNTVGDAPTLPKELALS
jgi:hypothetical protein